MSNNTNATQPALTPPSIDRRDVEKIMEEFTNLVQYYLPKAWDLSAEKNLGAAGFALANIFAGILENVIIRLNKLPERSFIEFLNTIGVNLIPAIPATTPVTFTLSPNVNQDVLIPASTKLAAGSSIFETEDDMLVTLSEISEIYSTDNTIDAIYRHTGDFAAKRSFILFGENTTAGGKSSNLQEHSLYLGHAELLNIKSCALVITFIISPENESDLDKIGQLIDSENKISRWEYNWDADPPSTLQVLPRPYTGREGGKYYISLQKNDEHEIKNLKVNGIESRWVRWKIASLKGLQLPTGINNIQIKVQNIISSATKITPDALAYNEVPFNIDNITNDTPLYPFGLKPATLDSFYIASQDAFSKLGAPLVLSFEFPPSPTAKSIPIHLTGGGGTVVPITLTGTPVAGDTGGLTFVLRNSPIYGTLSNTGSTTTSSTFQYMLSASAPPIATDNFTYIAIDSQGRESNIATVTIGINTLPLPPPLPTPTFNSPTAVLSWEYFNGKAWAAIGGSVTTDVTGAQVSFNCPLDIARIQVSGITDYWVRVKIASGNYGNIKMTSTTSQSGGITWSEDDSNIQEPQLCSLPTIEIKPSSVSTNLEQCLTYNNLEYISVVDTKGLSFQPFVGMEDVHPAVYFGFSNPGYIVSNLGPVQLLISLKERDIGVTQSIFDFTYYSKLAGQDLKYEEAKIVAVDGTSNFTKSGNIQLYFPPHIASPSKFGNNLLWIKAIDSTNTYAQNLKQKKTASTPVQGPEVNVIYLNTVSARQATTVNDEILGDSSALPDQTFTLTKIPISVSPSTFKLSINEGAYLSPDELTSLRQKKQVEEVFDPTGNLIGAWVLWTRVDDLYASGPNDRNYTLDTTLGTVQFGDNIKGMIPPEGSQNIRVTYVARDQTGGSVAIGEVNSLKTSIPYVDSVSNPEPAQGGADSEKTENALLRGPQLLKNRRQAVTSEDFEWLVRQQFPILARVKCMPATNCQGLYQPGYVSIAIVQTSNEDKPDVPLGLLNDVQGSLASCSSNVIYSSAQLRVVAPYYIKVSVSADIYPAQMVLASVVRDTALDTMTTFLHPLLGGFKGNGWDFGYLVSEADIYQKLATISEIDHANIVSIDYEDDTTGCSVSPASVLPHWLMYSGTHNLTLKPLGK